ncbi:MAG: DNA polymerase III subunit chi [Alphaproteobacteria bacterium]|nr:DNA polymerase III subunit chi [Alphaproteobacteria bacterium]
MSRIDFYHLQRQTLEEVLPKLLQKAYAADKRVLLKLPTEKVEEINTLLWTYNDESFLPHGSKKDGFAEEQPIWLTDTDNNANNAQFLFLACGVQSEVECAAAFERVFNIFDGNNQTALEQARQLWKIYKEAGFEVHYWQQTSTGSWEQKV